LDLHDPSGVLPGPLFLPPACRFILWAPRARHATLRLVGPVHRDVAMQPRPGGYYEAQLDGLAPGQRYFYRLDNGPDRPDPASRWQPDGVHGPSALVDPTFAWNDDGWKGIALADMVLYELHVGTFTPEGTFDAAIGELPRLRGLGVNAIEIMPVAQFPGGRNWGYDGVYPFAVQHTYGGAPGLKRLVDAAHRQGISVILDVVYNHFGPEGNYFRHYGPYFTDQYRNPWGEAINFDGHDSDPVRDFVIANVRTWQEEFHLDGLRLDSVPNIRDASAQHVLAEMADVCGEQAERLGRPFHLIGESDLNDPRILRPKSLGGHGLDAQWTDDFHHALHSYLTGERTGYYSDYGTLDCLARAYRDAYVLTGQYSRYRRRRYGASAADRPGQQFVIFAQNHDQVGNRVEGDRLSTLVDFETLKLAAGLLLTAPYVPMLFMGEEYGEQAPFPFFISHSDSRLIDCIRQGRKKEFAAFDWHAEPPDPQAEETFRRARLNVAQAREGRGKALHDWHRELLQLRRDHPALRPERERMEVILREEDALLCVRRRGAGEKMVLLFHFGMAAGRVKVLLEAGEWRKVLDSTEERWSGPGQTAEERVSGPGEFEILLPPRSVAIYFQTLDSRVR
jgi:maltooligosyltrehalose trehalohydrolase